MTDVLMQIFGIVSPLVTQIIKDWQAAHHTTDLPTVEQQKAQLVDNADKYLAEGAEWTIAHPVVPPSA